MESRMSHIHIENKTRCCGCTACENVCPKKCITMKPDSEGFLYPFVDESRCVGCGLCKKVCPILISPISILDRYVGSFVVQNKDPEVLCESTSGGAIDALYKYVIEELNGYAVGVAFDRSFMPIHMITSSYEEAKKFRNSKYAQSISHEIFSAISNILQQNKWVVYVGTPCQVAGLIKYLGKNYTKLITVDLVCRSIPSPKLWKDYLIWQERKHHSKIKNVSCRKKTYGYHRGALEIEFKNGRHYAGSNRVDLFMKMFHADICSRPSCYECQFKTKYRCSDFTVFDSWSPTSVSAEINVDNDKGFSNVLIHTKKGMDLIKEVPNLTLYSADAEKMFKYTGGMEANSIKRTEKRNSFYDDLEKIGFEATAKKYISVNFIDKFIEGIKPIFYSISKKVGGLKS